MANILSKEMINRLEENLKGIESANEEIIKVSQEIANRLSGEGRVIFVGAGMAPEMVRIILDELWFNFQIKRGKFVTLTAARNYIQDTDKWKELEEVSSASIFELDEIGLESNDLVIGLSASGKTQYVVSAMKYAHDIGCVTAAVTDFSKTKLEQHSDFVINTNFGQPPILGLNTGSGATIQKIVFDLLIYNSMLLSGKIYKGCLVFMKPVSSKIYGYCIETIENLLHLSNREAVKLFESVGNKLELALITKLKNCNIDEAAEILKDNDYNFNKIMNEE